MDASASLADHIGRVADALAAINGAREVEGRLIHEAQRVATELTHHRIRTHRLQAHLHLVLAETHAAAGLT